ncbi:unnamed protein product [[Candida] boidinii]|nr:unnamed protein product [[Candida] boidinii]
MSSLETAFENVRNRSRENSVTKNQHQHSSSLSQLISSNLNDLIIDRSPSKNDYFSSKNINNSSTNNSAESALRIEKLEKDSERLKIIKNDIKSFNNFKNKNFTDLSVAELSQIFNNYKFMIEEIEK